MYSVLYQLRQQIDKPRSLIGYATVPISLLEDAINEIAGLQHLLKEIHGKHN